MRFLLDGNMPRAALAVLEACGHEVRHVRDGELRDATDDVIAMHAAQHEEILVSRDLDFANVHRFPPHNAPGFLILRVPDDAVAAEIAALLQRFIDSAVAQFLPHRLTILETDRVRFRPALDP